MIERNFARCRDTKDLGTAYYPGFTSLEPKREQNMATDLTAPPILPRSPAIPPEKLVALGGQLVSIVIPCCGMLEYTQLCVASILKHSRMPYELIFLDVGSLDGTAEYLAGLKTGLANVRVELVRTPTDLGIPRACREALDRCRGEFLVLLNNDTVVTRGWLTQLTGLLTSSPAMGMVGPMSNYAAVPQLIETVPYRSGPRKSPKPADDPNAPRSLVDLEAVQSFAETVHEENKGKWMDAERLQGFCLMLKRELVRRLDQQGGLNKYTDLSLFDTDILSSKCRQLGYNLAVCRDLFIHHFGTRTFAHGAPTLAGTT